MSEQENRRIGDYEVLGVLGRGGMGQVLKVRNIISERIEAMKVILPDLAGSKDLADRFLREIKLLAGLDHPNIAALRTALTIENQLVMIMEYVEGTTVAAKLTLGPLAVSDAVNYIDQVLGALSYAHQHNIVHRDIKPSNIMVTPEGVVKLMDFGIARSGNASDLTATGATVGSLYYMSPEQVKGEPTDARSDLYSMGASLYEMATGQCPFKADSNYSLMAAQVQQAPQPPIELRANLPAALNDIILLAMAKEPDRRFQSAEAFRNALKTVPVPAAKPAVGAPRVAAAAGQTAGQGSRVSPLEQPMSAPPVAPGMMRPQGSHRGRYVALGGLLVAAFLVAAGLYIPRLSKTRAVGGQGQVEQNVSPTNPSPPPTESVSPRSAVENQMPATAVPSSPEPPSAGAISNEALTSRKGPASRKAVGADRATPGSSAGSQPSSPSAVATPPPPDNSAALAELEQLVDNLSAREASVNSSLENLRQQQAAQGVGLRGDMAAAQERMKIHIAKAQAAMQDRDVERAQKQADQAEADLEKLEKFLGR
jgi:serine/threonine protein kinase